jgi:hypothetical protein
MIFFILGLNAIFFILFRRMDYRDGISLVGKQQGKALSWKGRSQRPGGGKTPLSMPSLKMNCSSTPHFHDKEVKSECLFIIKII